MEQNFYIHMSFHSIPKSPNHNNHDYPKQKRITVISHKFIRIRKMFPYCFQNVFQISCECAFRISTQTNKQSLTVKQSNSTIEKTTTTNTIHINIKIYHTAIWFTLSTTTFGNSLQLAKSSPTTHRNTTRLLQCCIQ